MGFRGADLEDDGEGAPRQTARGDGYSWRDHPRRRISWSRHVSWRHLAIVLVYLAALVGAGALLARGVSTQAGAAVVVSGLIVLAVMAFKSRNRAGDSGMDAGAGTYGGGGGWDVGAGGDGGGGDG